MIEITPLLEDNSSHPLYLQLYEYIKKEIETGRFPAYTQMPSIRKLALYLQISQTTVESAYQQLLAEGYIDSQPRKGMFVALIEEDLPAQQLPHQQAFPTSEEKNAYRIDFHQAAVDISHFPLTQWKKCSNEVLHYPDIFLYGDPQGELSLREQLAAYLFVSRGVHATAAQIVIGAGTQQLLGLLSIIFRQKQYNVAFENPGYKGARDVFSNHGLVLHDIEVEEDGISIEGLRKSNSQIVYVTPSHQFPLGTIAPINKRKQLLKWAAEAERYIIEDDYDSEYRYTGRPIPSLQGLDTNNRVIYLGTFSKSFLPAVRISYMVLPPTLMNVYHEVFASYDQTVSKIHQEALALFMEKGYFHRHIRKIRKIHGQKREVLLKAITEHMPDDVTVIGDKSGVYVLLEVKLRQSEAFLIEQAKKHGIKVYPTSLYWAKPYKREYPMVQIGFGGLTEDEIAEGIYRLSKAWM